MAHGVHQGKRLGYGMSALEELQVIGAFAQATGIVLDPVNSGKAFYHFARHIVMANPSEFGNKNILFRCLVK